MKLLKSVLVFAMAAQLFTATAFAGEDHVAARKLSDGNVYDSNGDNWGVAWGWAGGSLAGLIASGLLEWNSGSRFDGAARNTQIFLGVSTVVSGIIAAVGTWK